MAKKAYRNFSEFYQFYLSQHENRLCRRFHFIGSSLALGFLISLFFSLNWLNLLLALFSGYGFAWLGHFLYERNKPATFMYPILSFIGDWVMYWQMISGKIKF